MASQWLYTLLLLYKDRLEDGESSSFPLQAESTSILVHRRSAQPKQLPKNSTPLLRLEPTIATVPQDTCLWGWWRKPWERQSHTFTHLKSACDAGERPSVLLFNQYLRQLYSAQLFDVFFHEAFTTTSVPHHLQHLCPEYYRHDARLCGCFFLLKIGERHLAPDQKLAEYFVDPRSFPRLLTDGEPAAIPPPSELPTPCREVCFASPSRAVIRSADHTLLILRRHGRAAAVTNALVQGTSDQRDQRASEAITDAQWKDVAPSLRGASMQLWRNLRDCPRALTSLGTCAQRSGAQLTRFDFALFTQLLSADEMDPLLKSADRRSLSALGKAMVAWLTTNSPREARLHAAAVFEEAWQIASKRYGLAPVAEYLGKLSGLESLTGALKHDIAGKFYRDHLAHNVRAALLSARLAISTKLSSPHANVAVVAFFAGLYHDLSLPIVGYPELVRALAKELRVAPFVQPPNTELSLLDPDKLRIPLHYATILASIPQVIRKAGSVAWTNPHDLMNATDTALQHELSLCAQSAEHAIVSAAILLYQASEHTTAKGEKRGIDTVLRELFESVNPRPEAREFLALLQAIALHDRRPSVRHWGAAEHRHHKPHSLSWSKYDLPIVVAVADECQEWGRPIGPVDGMGMIDADIEWQDDHLNISFALNVDVAGFSAQRFNPFEAAFGKVRVINQHRVGPVNAEVPLAPDVTLTGLDCYELAYLAKGVRLMLTNATVMNGQLGTVTFQPDERVDEPTGVLVSMKFRGATECRDIVILTGGGTDELAHSLVKPQTLSSILTNGRTVHIKLGDGSSLDANVVSYRTGAIQSGGTPPMGGDQGSVLTLQVTSIARPDVVVSESRVTRAKSVGAPHFLDYDWRFTDDTCKVLTSAARKLRSGGQIAYLGCPTLALWDHASGQRDYVLLDRGHWALKEWIRQGMLPADVWRNYDVFREPNEGLRDAFDVVITDPPWYKIEYEMFLRRAWTLARPGGIIGVSAYPTGGPYDSDKHGELKFMVAELYSSAEHWGASEICYDTPDFETSWGGHVRYLNTGFDVYRPGYVDFFRVPQDKRELPPPSAVLGVLEPPLPKIVPLDGPHYLRVGGDTIFGGLYGDAGVHVGMSTYKEVRRLRKTDEWSDVVAWSTRNTLVRQTRSGVLIRDDEELAKVVREWEERTFKKTTAGM